MDDLETEIRKLIVQALKLEDITWQDVDSAAPLFGEGLGLDSIDALELGVAIRQRYGIKIEAVNDEIRAHFFSVRSLAQFIDAQRGNAQRGNDRVAR
jgi:acyl carrier protein